MPSTSERRTFATQRVLGSVMCVGGLFVVSDGTYPVFEAVAALVTLFFVVRIARMGIVVESGEITVRNIFWTYRGRADEVSSVGMEGRWYIKFGQLTVLRLRSGRAIACIGLSGLGKRADSQVTELAALLDVPRIDGKARAEVDR